MRILFLAAGAALATMTAVPAFAQGCGGAQGAAANTTTAQSAETPAAGGMCGGASAAAADTPKAAGGCSCCSSMAMMKPGDEMELETPAEPSGTPQTVPPQL